MLSSRSLCSLPPTVYVIVYSVVCQITALSSFNSLSILFVVYYTPFLQYTLVCSMHSQQYCLQFVILLSSNTLQFTILPSCNNCQQSCFQSTILLSSNIFQFAILPSSNNCQQYYLQSAILFSFNSFQFAILPSSNNFQQYCLQSTTPLSFNSLQYTILSFSNTLPNFLLFFPIFNEFIVFFE